MRKFALLFMVRSSLSFYSFVFLVSVVFSSCNSYQKLLKSNDTGLKYKKAEEYYKSGDYQKAIDLYENVINFYRGTSQAEDLYYHLAYSYFKVNDYQLACYQFKNFADAYPVNVNAEDANFYYAYCLYKGSPVKDLDQENSVNAIDAFQLFVNKYPESKRIEECNKYIDELRAKIESKAIDNAVLYYNIEDYKSAVYAIRNVLNDYPATKQREYLQFLMVKSAWLLAKKSIEEKKLERYVNTIQLYNDFKEKFSKSKYDGEARKIYEDANSQLNKLKTKKNEQSSAY